MGDGLFDVGGPAAVASVALGDPPFVELSTPLLPPADVSPTDVSDGFDTKIFVVGCDVPLRRMNVNKRGRQNRKFDNSTKNTS